MLKWIKKFSQEPDPLPPLGFEPRFFDPGNAPLDSVTASVENDDETTLEFVVQFLNEYFGFTINGAAEIALRIHNEGSAEIRVMQSVDAERVISKIQQETASRGFPLKLTTSPTVRT